MKSKLLVARDFFSKRKFALFIIICICIALIMTGISLELYRSSDAIKLDMSRPGYEKVRAKVEKTEENNNFDSSGPLNDKVYEDFGKRIHKFEDDLEKLDNYEESTVSDENLNLTKDKDKDKDKDDKAAKDAKKATEKANKSSKTSN